MYSKLISISLKYRGNHYGSLLFLGEMKTIRLIEVVSRGKFIFLDLWRNFLFNFKRKLNGKMCSIDKKVSFHINIETSSSYLEYSSWYVKRALFNFLVDSWVFISPFIFIFFLFISSPRKCSQNDTMRILNGSLIHISECWAFFDELLSLIIEFVMNLMMLIIKKWEKYWQIIKVDVTSIFLLSKLHFQTCESS